MGAGDGETPWVGSDERPVGQMGSGLCVAGKVAVVADKADFRGRVFGGEGGDAVRVWWRGCMNRKGLEGTGERREESEEGRGGENEMISDKG